MSKNIKKAILFLIVLISFAGGSYFVIHCLDQNSNSNFKIRRYTNGKILWKMSYDLNGKRKGPYFKYFEDGSIMDIGTWNDDSTRINERYQFHVNGKLFLYRFYNIIGEITYEREYDTIGKLVNERGGGFFSYLVLDSFKLHIGSTQHVKMYFATPPGCYVDLFRQKKNVVFKVFTATGKNNIYKWDAVEDRKGHFLFKYKAVFHDTVYNKLQFDSTSFCYDVIK